MMGMAPNPLQYSFGEVSKRHGPTAMPGAARFLGLGVLP